MPTIFVKDTLRAAVEGGSGGQVTVLYDDKGYPSYMVRIPKFKLEDIDPLLGTGVHPAFVVGGVEKSELLVGAYQAKVYDGRACSVAGVDPTTSVTYDQARAYCSGKGPGFHLMTNWEWAAVALRCLKDKFQPRGNTAYGKSHEAPSETGTRVDGGTPGATTGTPRTRTGSGPASWRHDGFPSGIDGLVGNVAEIVDGFKLTKGQIRMPADNDYSLADSAWPDTGFRFDSTATGDANSAASDIGDPILSDVVTKFAGPDLDDGAYAYTYIAAWKDLAQKSGITIPSSLVAAAIAPITALGGAYAEGAVPKGALYVRNYGERVLYRGGNWIFGALAGLFCLYCLDSRANASGSLGFRPAFLA
jgi:hypothetical protein